MLLVLCLFFSLYIIVLYMLSYISFYHSFSIIQTLKLHFLQSSHFLTQSSRILSQNYISPQSHRTILFLCHLLSRVLSLCILSLYFLCCFLSLGIIVLAQSFCSFLFCLYVCCVCIFMYYIFYMFFYFLYINKRVLFCFV